MISDSGYLINIFNKEFSACFGLIIKIKIYIIIIIIIIIIIKSIVIFTINSRRIEQFHTYMILPKTLQLPEKRFRVRLN